MVVRTPPFGVGGLLQQAKVLRVQAGRGALAPSGGVSMSSNEESPLNQQKGKFSVPPAPEYFLPMRRHEFGVGWMAGFLTEESRACQRTKLLAGTGGL